MAEKERLRRRPVELLTLGVFTAGVVAFVLLHSATLVTSRGGPFLADVRLAWFVFVVGAVAAAAFLVAESTGRV
ncbi:hypothetical protein AUR64_07505 [Haloprofundus marisrubri]|uniref:Uncharacterized protein n=1 Tax=Haloprofundus marisrubri TaxID=1514971 RepID=A0A0W1RD82_9EURY|nr:hypothetical protein [Haloprofundus marisrubri]KTG11004.1 hypothetical protein AUR64_07505 [Haloprofundus marisrubri]